MHSILFVVSLTSTLLFILSVVAKYKLPLIPMSNYTINFTNTIICVPAITYQVWYWSVYFKLI